MLNNLIEEYLNGEFLLSSDPKKLDIDIIHGYLNKNSYWAQNIPKNVVRRSINNSLCFGLYHGTVQIGLTRVITDKATFAYLADTFVISEFQGKKLGTWMIETIMKSSELQGLRRWQLSTRDAHSFYHKFGFHSLEYPGRHMTIKYHNVYMKNSD
ncbi:MAG: GNAT family N-acetyltransferase [Promethearchaeota archaeon]